MRSDSTDTHTAEHAMGALGALQGALQRGGFICSSDSTDTHTAEHAIDRGTLQGGYLAGEEGYMLVPCRRGGLYAVLIVLIHILLN